MDEQLQQLSGSLTELQDSLTGLAQNAGVTQQPVTPSMDLEQVEQSQNIQPQADVPEGSSQALINQIANLPSAFGGEREEQTTQEQDELAQLVQGLEGRSADTARLTEEAGVPDLEAQIRDIGTDISRRRAALTSDLETIGQQGFRATAVRGQEARARRQTAAEISGLEAAQSAAQGQLITAQSAVERAVQTKYGPIQEQIDIQKQLIEVRKDQMTREQQKRAETRQTQLDILNNQLVNQRSLEQNAYEQINEAASNGFSPARAAELAQKVASGQIQPTDVLSEVGGWQKDPIDRAIKQAQLAKLQEETRLLGEPTAAERQAIQDAITARNEEQEAAKASLPIMYDKVEAIKVLKDHGGKNSRVGTSILTRDAQGFIGNVSKFALGGFLGPSTEDAKDKLTGAGQEFSGGVHKLVTGLTIDELQEAKERGATFGALSDAELSLLANSASAINDWEIKDDKNMGVGVWDIDEKSFDRELDTIITLTNRAIERSTGTLVSPEEQNAIEEAIETLQQQSDPLPGQSYYD